jgi:hypothetical protein
MICVFDEAESAQSILDEAKRQNGCEREEARRFALQTLYDYRRKDVNELSDATTAELLSRYPNWERSYARNIVQAAGQQLAYAFALTPVSRLTTAVESSSRDSRPQCCMCWSAKADGMYLVFSSWTVAPACHSCAQRQLPSKVSV